MEISLHLINARYTYDLIFELLQNLFFGFNFGELFNVCCLLYSASLLMKFISTCNEAAFAAAFPLRDRTDGIDEEPDDFLERKLVVLP